MGLIKTLVAASIQKTVINTAADAASKVIDTIDKNSERKKDRQLQRELAQHMIQLPCDSDNYIGRKMPDVDREIKALGFNNVGYNDIHRGFFDSPRSVTRILIDGQEHVKKGTRIRHDARFTIEYYRE